MNDPHQNNQRNHNQQHEGTASPHWQPPERATVTTAGAAVSGTIIMVIITGVFGLITSCKLVSTVTSTPTPMPTPVVPTLVFIPALSADDCRAARLPESACTGISHNDEWEPYIQNFNGVDVALVPAGCFMMGSTEDQIDYAVQFYEETGRERQREWFEHEKPAHEVCFDEPFWIDVYEVTNAQYGSAASDCTQYSSDDDQPRVCVNWNDSKAHCESRGARLPTEAEWEYAARGPDGLVYPWGNDFDGELLNYCDKNCEEVSADKNGDDGYAYTAPVGTYPGGGSWVGAYDLSGNVWEWVNDWYGAYPAEAQVNPAGPGSGDFRVLRGGSWNLSSSYVRAASRPGSTPDLTGNNLGFRCVLSYQP